VLQGCRGPLRLAPAPSSSPPSQISAAYADGRSSGADISHTTNVVEEVGAVFAQAVSMAAWPVGPLFDARSGTADARGAFTPAAADAISRIFTACDVDACGRLSLDDFARFEATAGLFSDEKATEQIFRVRMEAWWGWGVA